MSATRARGAPESGMRHGRNDDHGLREGNIVRERAVDARLAAFRRDAPELPQRAALEHQRGPARGQIHDAHVAEEDAAAEARAERLGTGLLGGEALGVGRGPRGARLGLAPLRRREDAVREALAVALEHALDPPDVHEIAAEADDHDTATGILASSMRRRICRTLSAKPTKSASPTRKWPILSSSISGIAATSRTFP